MSKMLKLIGQRFARLLVLRRDESKPGRVFLICLCDCGNTVSVVGSSLTNGNTKSCGCYRRGLPTQNFKTHGMTGTSEYGTWRAMLNRCENPNVKSYERYGGRGIKVCRRWREFQNFLEDMGKRPAGLTLERRDNNGDYNPRNCRWATKFDQAHNKSSSLFLTRNGETLPLAVWANRVKLPYLVLYNRKAKGWTPDRILSQPIRKTSRTKITT